jgi:hypothetical protein
MQFILLQFSIAPDNRGLNTGGYARVSRPTWP